LYFSGKNRRKEASVVVVVVVFCRQWVLSSDPVSSGALVAIQDVVVASILFFL
jgi:hypothetical protein